MHTSFDWDVFAFNDGGPHIQARPLSDESFHVLTKLMVEFATNTEDVRFTISMKKGRRLSKQQETDLTIALVGIGAKTLKKSDIILTNGVRISIEYGSFVTKVPLHTKPTMTRAERAAARERAKNAMMIKKPSSFKKKDLCCAVKDEKRIPVAYSLFPRLTLVALIPPLPDDPDWDLRYPVPPDDTFDLFRPINLPPGQSTVVADNEHSALLATVTDDADDDSTSHASMPGPLTQLWETTLDEHLDYLISYE